MTKEELHVKMQESLNVIGEKIIPNVTKSVMDAYELGVNKGLEIGIEHTLQTCIRWVNANYKIPSDFEQQLRKIMSSNL